MSKPSRSGAAMSSKQLARTVMDGRAVTFHVPGRESITGYLCGMDDFHWMVITASGFEKYLIHKGSASVVQIAERDTYSKHPDKDQMEPLIGPFRRYVGAEFFGRSDAPASTEGVPVVC